MKYLNQKLILALIPFALSGSGAFAATVTTMVAPYQVQVTIDRPLEPGVKSYILQADAAIAARNFSATLIKNTELSIDYKNGVATITAFAQAFGLVINNEGDNYNALKITSININGTTLHGDYLAADIADDVTDDLVPIYPDGFPTKVMNSKVLRTTANVAPNFKWYQRSCVFNSFITNELDLLENGSLTGCTIEITQDAELAIKTQYGEAMHLVCPSQRLGGNTDRCYASIQNYESGYPSSVFIGQPWGAYLTAKLKVLGGTKLHSFYQTMYYLKLDQRGRVIEGTLDNEPLTKNGKFSSTLNAYIEYKNGKYDFYEAIGNFTNTEGGFVLPTQKVADAYCKSHGGTYSLNEESQASVEPYRPSLKHALIFNTQYFYDLSNGTWVPITDQPYDFYTNLQCYMTDVSGIKF